MPVAAKFGNGMSSSRSARPSPTSPRTLPAVRPNFSRATRRAIRQAAQLANELNMYSFRVHVDGSTTWVPNRRDPPAQPPQKKCEDKAGQHNGEPTKRAPKRIERAREHRERMEKAARFRCARALRCWARATAPRAASSGASATPQSHLDDTGDGIPGAVAACSDGDSAIPLRRIDEDDAAPLPAQPQGSLGYLREGDVRAADKRAHTSPAAGTPSPTARAPAKARRALVPADVEHGAAAEGRCAGTTIVCAGTAHEGGATQQIRTMLPPCQPTTPSNPPGSREGWQGPLGASAPCVTPQQTLAHLRMHEYPAFMNYHVQQGVPEGEAFGMWQAYEYKRMTEGHAQPT
jgi:hypothetical protein